MKGNIRHTKNLLPTGSDERGILGVGSISTAILTSCQYMTNIGVKSHKNRYNWVVELRNTSEAVFRPQYTPRPQY